MGRLELITSVISILLFSSVSLLSVYYYDMFGRRSRDTKQRGRYDETKMVFFAVLACSACLDIPWSIACIAIDSPDQCTWGTGTFYLVWSLHLLALCGYALCLSIPPVLWSDIVNHGDGRLFFSEEPADAVKLFFRSSVIVYFLIEALTIFAMNFQANRHNVDSFVEHNVIYNILTIAEPIVILGIVGCCLYCGIRLQAYVIRVQLLQGASLMNFVVSINLVMILMIVTYLTRAFFVLSIVVTSVSISAINDNYFLWMIVSRWLPHVLCLIFLMKLMKQTHQDTEPKGLLVSFFCWVYNLHPKDFYRPSAKDTTLFSPLNNENYALVNDNESIRSSIDSSYLLDGFYSCDKSYKSEEDEYSLNHQYSRSRLFDEIHSTSLENEKESEDSIRQFQKLGLDVLEEG